MPRLPLPLAILALALAPAVPAAAQRGGAQHPAGVQAAADMRSRIAAADERIVSARRHGKLPAARATALRRQVAAAQRDMARRHGTIGAGDLASYDRLVVAIDAELSARAGGGSYGDDALPSAEVTAFRAADARLRYRDARIERDARDCAVYQGTASDGRVRHEPLRDLSGRPICLRR